jgi:hypothetical protein
MENHMAAAIDHIYLGPRGWCEWTDDLFEPFGDGACYDVRHVIAVEDDVVVASFRVAGVSVWTHNPLQLSWIGVTWFRDGQATGAVGVTSRADALTAIDQHPAKAESADAPTPA